MTFQELHLLPELLRAVGDIGYRTPSPIQAAAIGPVLAGRDLIGCAQTGTGKTAAFAIPILQRLSRRGGKSHKPIRALILTPTRELALQIKENFDLYGKYLPLKNTVIFGGVGQAPQVEALRAGVDILVATPGRLNDLCSQGHIDLRAIETFVLDEADRMLDMGFIHDVRKVIARLPERRQTLLFSATMPQEIADLSKQILHDPIRVEVTPQSSTVEAIEQQVYHVDKPNKKRLLAWLLGQRDEPSVLVFTATKHGADRVVRELGQAGITAMAIHGNKSQTNRVKALESFKHGTIRVLVATDIAARGIDISELPLVINYELPNVPETYVHRIGRTGRAGRSGLAISFCNFDELPYLRDIEKLTGRKLEVQDGHPWPMEILEATPKAQRQPRQKPQAASGKHSQDAKTPLDPPAKPRGSAKRGQADTAPSASPAKTAKSPRSSGKTVQPKEPSRSGKLEKAAVQATRQELFQAPPSHRPIPIPPPPEPPKQPARKLRSGAPELPGRVVAFADGRRRPRRRSGRGGQGSS